MYYSDLDEETKAIAQIIYDNLGDSKVSARELKEAGFGNVKQYQDKIAELTKRLNEEHNAVISEYERSEGHRKAAGEKILRIKELEQQVQELQKRCTDLESEVDDLSRELEDVDRREYQYEYQTDDETIEEAKKEVAKEIFKTILDDYKGVDYFDLLFDGLQAIADDSYGIVITRDGNEVSVEVE